jgi:tRNA-2-methylthio-N6-dimethylallyladenosine synthase
VGSLQTVLVEGRSKTDDTRLTGRTEQNRLVHFEGDDALIGSQAIIRITRAEPHALYGELE